MQFSIMQAQENKGGGGGSSPRSHCGSYAYVYVAGTMHSVLIKGDAPVSGVCF